MFTEVDKEKRAISEHNELKRLAMRMYEETWRRIDDPRWEAVVGSKVTVLFGPPMVRPDVVVVSFQGGGEDQSPSRRRWPDRLLYLDDDFSFGPALRSQFAEAGLLETLGRKTVAMATCFPEAPVSEASLWMRKTGPRAEWREFSTAWVKRMLAAMRPSAVLVFGTKASEALGLADRWRDAKRRESDRHMVFGRTEVEGFPAVYCHHLSQAWDAQGVQRCLREVKRLVADGAP